MTEPLDADELDALGRLLARLVAPHLAEALVELGGPGAAQAPHAPAVSAGTDAADRVLATAMRAEGLSKSEVMRRPHGQGWERSRIARALDVRYQFVQNVLKADGLI